jgi:hypothetical protein
MLSLLLGFNAAANIDPVKRHSLVNGQFIAFLNSQSPERSRGDLQRLKILNK